MLSPFQDELTSYGAEWGDNGFLRLEVTPWPNADGVDVRVEHGQVETHHYDCTELYALSVCIERAIEAGKLKFGHVDAPPNIWAKIRAWFLPARKRGER